MRNCFITGLKSFLHSHAKPKHNVQLQQSLQFYFPEKNYKRLLKTTFFYFHSFNNAIFFIFVCYIFSLYPQNLILKRCTECMIRMLMFLYKCLDSDNKNIASERTVKKIKTKCNCWQCCFKEEVRTAAFQAVETASAATLVSKRDPMFHTNKGQPVSHNGCLFVYSY